MQKPLTTLTELDQAWLKAFDPAERPAALAWLHYRKAMGDAGLDKKSRPTLFMEGFQVGAGYRDTLEKGPDPDGVA